jgi:hypothetical protein
LSGNRQELGRNINRGKSQEGIKGEEEKAFVREKKRARADYRRGEEPGRNKGENE